MANQSSVLSIPGGATKALVGVPLHEFVLIPERYCHRDPEELSDEKRLKPLMDSIVAGGLATPPEFYRNADKLPVVTKGHRRITAMRFLAQSQVSGFQSDMPVQALEVSGCSDEDLLLGSAVDNWNRKDYTLAERLRVIHLLHQQGVPVEKVAPCFGVSVKTLQRSVLLVQHEWMYRLVLDNCIVASNAVLLLEAAIREGRLTELEDDFKEWVVEMKKKIDEKERLRHLHKGAALRPAEQQVSYYLSPDLLTQWLAQLRKKEHFAKEVAWNFGASIDADTNRLQIERLRMDVTKVPLTQLATVASKLSKLSKEVMQYLKARHAVEAPQGPQDMIRADKGDPFDLELLRDAGLTDLADELELQTLADSNSV